MTIPTVKLNNGNEIPQIGMGTMFVPPPKFLDYQLFVDNAIEAGYRLFDTAALYGNEAQLGNAFKNCKLDRKELFISSKLKNGHHKYDDALREFEGSLKRLNIDYLDMYLIHYPCPQIGEFPQAWKALEHLYEQGLVKNIGVSNFHRNHLEKLFTTANIKPVVDQLECNPYLTIEPLREFLKSNDIVTEAWFPIGGPSHEFLMPGTPKPKHGPLRENRLIQEIAEKYGRAPAQIILRWETQLGFVVVPRSSNPEHMQQNISIFDFSLADEDMKAIASLNENYYSAPNGDTCNEVWD